MAMILRGPVVLDDWTVLFEKIERGTLSANARVQFGGGGRLLHWAASFPPPVMATLLASGANPSLTNKRGDARPMHAVVSASDAEDMLDKCKMLPVSDLAAVDQYGRTPLRLLLFELRVLCLMTQPAGAASARRCQLEAVLTWMLDQPECPLDSRDSDGRTLQQHAGKKSRAAAAISAAMAQRARWSPARAAWTAAVVAAAAGAIKPK
jgi:hypothetical protein